MRWPDRKRKVVRSWLPLRKSCASPRQESRRHRSAGRRSKLQLVRKQAELKYLEETSRKELDCTLEEVSRRRRDGSDEVGLAEIEQK